jgi:hypothetical protein
MLQLQRSSNVQQAVPWGGGRASAGEAPRPETRGSGFLASSATAAALATSCRSSAWMLLQTTPLGKIEHCYLLSGA